MRRINRKESDESREPIWLTTFSDAMSLMLTFFVMLFAATVLQKSKLEPALGSLRGALGMMEEKKPVMVSPSQVMSEKERIVKSIKQISLSKGLEEEMEVKIVKEGVRVNLSNPILFSSGKAELKREIFPLLDKIAAFFQEIPNQIIIEGHTDNIPIHTERFPSNWELSATRAIHVARYLIRKGVSPSRIGVVGYADSRPLFPNDTKQHRAANRRVEIFIRENNAS